MNKDRDLFNIKYIFIPLISLIFGIILGLELSNKKKIKKEYPIEVQTHWETDGYQSYPKMQCDSIKGDTLYKDGDMIINKNIINVSFKNIKP